MKRCSTDSSHVRNSERESPLRACSHAQEGTLVHAGKEAAEKPVAQSNSRRTMFTGRKDLQAADPAPLPHPNPNGTATINVQPTVAAC